MSVVALSCSFSVEIISVPLPAASLGAEAAVVGARALDSLLLPAANRVKSNQIKTTGADGFRSACRYYAMLGFISERDKYKNTRFYICQ